MEKNIKKGDLVWAKVRGFPWWPAVVKNTKIKIIKEINEDDETSEQRETTLLVYFIGDNTHSYLPQSKVYSFEEKLPEFSKTRKKSLLTSIRVAEKIRAGEIPFEKHLMYSKRRLSKESRPKEECLDKSESDQEEVEVKKVVKKDKNKCLLSKPSLTSRKENDARRL